MRKTLIALVMVISLVASIGGAPVGATEPPESLGKATMSYSVLANAQSLYDILSSSDYQESDGDILRLYQAFFNRLPDAGGAVYWIDVARDGATLDEIAEWFTLSLEFANTYAGTSDVIFLYTVYDYVLGRDYDIGGFNYWLSLMQSGLSRGAVVRWVAANDEFINQYPFAPIAPDTNTYQTIYDESGSISVSVPTHWNDFDGRGWSDNGDFSGTPGIIGPALTASPDLDAWYETWGTPGVFIGVSPLLYHTPTQLLDAYGDVTSCTYLGRYVYDDGLYTGVYDYYEDCGAENSIYWVITAEPIDQSWVALINVIAVTNADTYAFDRIVASWTVQGVAG